MAGLRSKELRTAGAVAALTLMALGVPAAFGQEKTEVRDFAAGGNLRVTMRVGDIRIVKGRDAQHIRLYYTARSEKDDDRADKATARFNVKGNDTEIEFSAPRHVDFDAEIEVPAQTNLTVRLKVGDLRLEQIEGNKDLDVYIGDIRADVGPKSDYSMVEAGTHIGDVDGAAFGEPHGWLGKSLRYHGNGQYRLVAHTSIGDVTLF